MVQISRIDAALSVRAPSIRVFSQSKRILNLWKNLKRSRDMQQKHFGSDSISTTLTTIGELDGLLFTIISGNRTHTFNLLHLTVLQELSKTAVRFSKFLSNVRSKISVSLGCVLVEVGGMGSSLKSFISALISLFLISLCICSVSNSHGKVFGNWAKRAGTKWGKTSHTSLDYDKIALKFNVINLCTLMTCVTL